MFKQPFSFEGRIRRTEYGLSYLIYIAVYMIAAVIAGAFQGLGGGQETVPILMVILYIPMFWFLLAQGAKRCHDRNNSGWYQIIPFYGLWMLFGEGDYGPNDYGPDPKNPDLGTYELIDEIGKEEIDPLDENW